MSSHDSTQNKTLAALSSGRGIYARIGKRGLDLAVTVPCALLLAPLLGLIGLLVYRQFGRPVIFRQLRPGLRGELFTLYKFRTMGEIYDTSGHLLPDAERLTPFGRLLRSTSLDELPEMLNILRGEMSLVGPRPLLVQYLDLYTQEQMRRHEVRPGITGWAQVNGRNTLSWEQKFAYDVWYVDHLSLWLDFRIMIMTIWTIICRKGITAPGAVTMHEFTGTPPSLDADK